MYAVFEDGSRQYKVARGDVVRLDLRELQPGQSTLEMDRVLLVSDEEGTRVGTPLVQGAKVVLDVRGETKGPKLFVVKYRRRKDSKTRVGHRQRYVEAVVREIKA